MYKEIKNIIHSGLVLLLFFCSLQKPLAQETEQPELYLNFGFYKVDQDKRASYELLMTDFFGPLMQKRVDEGCLSNWLFRRVLPNSSLYGEFTHITIDIMAPGGRRDIGTVTLNYRMFFRDSAQKYVNTCMTKKTVSENWCIGSGLNMWLDTIPWKRLPRLQSSI